MGRAGLAALARTAGNRMLPLRSRLSSATWLSSATGHRTDCPEMPQCSSWSSSYAASPWMFLTVHVCLFLGLPLSGSLGRTGRPQCPWSPPQPVVKCGCSCATTSR